MSEAAGSVLDAITGRCSIRAFLPPLVERETVEQILQAAARAPSGRNIQPWQVLVLSGEALAQFGGHLSARAAPRWRTSLRFSQRTVPDEHRALASPTCTGSPLLPPL